MSRATYAPEHDYVGTGSKSDYTFDFLITDLEQLLVIESDGDGNETNRVRGSDTSTLISSVTYDNISGGGTVNLLSNLTSGYGLKILLADDAPVQDFQFRSKTSFTLRTLEKALDNLSGAVQRLTWLQARSIRLHSLDDESSYNVEIEQSFVGEQSKALVTNAAGDRIVAGPTTDEIANAQTYATAAQTAQTAAEAAQAAAEAAQAAAEAAAGDVSFGSPIAVTAAQANSLSGETFTAADYKAVFVRYHITRGTTIAASGRIILQDLNGTWRVKVEPYEGEVHGVTWSLSGSTTLQIVATLDAGDNGEISLSKEFVPVS